jgi:hypothetical protein
MDGQTHIKWNTYLPESANLGGKLPSSVLTVVALPFGLTTISDVSGVTKEYCKKKILELLRAKEITKTNIDITALLS